MKERIQEFLKAENKSSAQLAEEIGVQPSGISHILSGRNNPSLDFVMKMLDKYKYLSVDWLLFGKGPMYREKASQDLFNELPISGERPEIMTKVEDNEIDRPDKSGKSAYYESGSKGKVEKIVWFYNDNSFREYFPENE